MKEGKVLVDIDDYVYHATNSALINLLDKKVRDALVEVQKRKNADTYDIRSAVVGVEDICNIFGWTYYDDTLKYYEKKSMENIGRSEEDDGK